jgi:hypothetical protein
MTVCVGQSSTLLESSAGGVWTISNSLASISDSGVVSGITAGTDTVTYTVTTVCGSAFITRVLTINPLPAMAVISGGDSICTGASELLGASLTGGVWSSANITLAVVDTDGTVHALAPGADTVIYTTTNSCGNALATFVLQVLTLPDPGVIVAPDSICQSSVITLSDLVSGGTWSDTSLTAATITGDIYTANGTGNDIIRYTLFNMCGSNFATKSLYIKALPDVGVITGSAATCIGSNTTLSETVTGGVWVSTDHSVATISASGVVTGLLTGMDSIRYDVTNSCGTYSASELFFVDTLIVPSVTGSSMICNGGTHNTDTLTGMPIGGAWSTSVSADSIVNGVLFGNVAGTVVVSYSFFNSCGTFVNPVTFNVLPMPDPGAITGVSYNVCTGAAKTYSDATTGGVWSISNSNATLSVSGGNAVIAGLIPGTDTLSYMVTNTCGTTTVTQILTVDATPTPVLHISIDSTSLYTAAGYTTYQWYENGTLIPGITDTIYHPHDTGSYTVLVTDAAGCSGMSGAVTISRLAVESLSAGSGDISVFPNPTLGIVYIRTNTPVDVVLNSMDGKTILSGHNATQIDLSALPVGIYLMRCQDPVNGAVRNVVRITKSE